MLHLDLMLLMMMLLMLCILLLLLVRLDFPSPFVWGE
jgi:hypothetical protein